MVSFSRAGKSTIEAVEAKPREVKLFSDKSRDFIFGKLLFEKSFLK